MSASKTLPRHFCVSQSSPFWIYARLIIRSFCWKTLDDVCCCLSGKAALRMCLNDEDCQLVLIAIDLNLPVYLNDVRCLPTILSTTKMIILGSVANPQYSPFTCLDVGNMIRPASQPSRSPRHGDDEARWIPQTYSAVTKIPSSDENRSDSKTPLAMNPGSDKTETWKPNAPPNALTIPRKDVHGKFMSSGR